MSEKKREYYIQGLEEILESDVVAYFTKGTMKDLLELLKEEPERKKGNWIPCSERLPEEDEEVLVSVHFMGLKQTHPNGWNDHIKPNYYVEIASHIDGEWSSDSDEYKVARSRHKVIAWMPLPKPYGGEEE